MRDSRHHSRHRSRSVRPKGGDRDRDQRRTPVLGLVLTALLGCKGADPATSGVSSSSSAQPAPSGVLSAIQLAEQARMARSIPEAAIGARDVRVRRAVAAALARIGDTPSVERLVRLLPDPDREVVAWAAYGLGYACPGRESTVVGALATRAATLVDERIASRDPVGQPARSAAPANEPVADPRFVLDPGFAFSDALGRCATPEAEQTLRTWLADVPALADGAALALGRVARQRGRLQDASIVALVDAAGGNPPVGAALWALAQLNRLSDATRTELAELATGALARGGSRAWALEALGKTGSLGIPALSAALGDSRLPSAERSLAAIELARLGDEGQAALRDATPRLIGKPSELDEAVLMSPEWAPMAAALDALEPPVAALNAQLLPLSELPIVAKTSAAQQRRAVTLRCSAARLLAGTLSLARRLVACDPDPKGRIGAVATLRVLDKGKLTGARLARWLELTRSSDPLVRQRAIALLAKHPEVKDGQAVLAQAIGEGSPGVLSVAARLIVDHPELAGSGEEAPRSAPAPAPELIRALSSALDQNRPADQVEPRAAVIEAMGTLQLLSAKSTVEKYCGHRNPTLREAARRALGRLGDAQRDCIDLGGGTGLVASKLADKPATLTFVTDAGRLGMTLHPQHAPAAVARVVELARRGFYNGLEVHVRGGTVVQFGDPTGDGYGGSGTDPLPSETSPLSFDALRVGMAQSGRDTGSSQVFVTLTPQPRLSGDYPLIGWADPEWAQVSDGDRIREVIVKE